MGIAFMKQYTGAGVDVPLLGPAFSLRPEHPPGRGRRAAGRQEHLAMVQKDLDNETKQGLVESYQAEYNRLPSLYSSQGFDTRQPP